MPTFKATLAFVTRICLSAHAFTVRRAGHELCYAWICTNYWSPERPVRPVADSPEDPDQVSSHFLSAIDCLKHESGGRGQDTKTVLFGTGIAVGINVTITGSQDGMLVNSGPQH